MHALIIGAGIAGPVAAMALQKAGLEATVVEAHARTAAEVGSVLTIAPNGLDAIAAVDAMDCARAVGHATRRIVLWNERGGRLGETGLGSPLPDGTPAQTLKRAHLADRLAREAEHRGIRVEYGRRLVDARVTSAGRVRAAFDDGGTEEADLLVGADGVHSVTRRLIDPAAPTARFVGLTNFGGITRSASLPADESWHMIFGRRAFFGYLATPAGDVVWFVNWPRRPIERSERVGLSPDAWRARLAALFVEDAGPAARLIAEGELELIADNTHDLPHVPVWHRGPMVLIGDAAHAPSPSSGQGAAMAAEDGVILARALRDASSIPAALRAYENERRARVEKIVRWGARGSAAKIPGRVGRIFRDAGMRFAFKYFATPASMAWQFDHRIEWEAPLELSVGS